MLVTQNDGKPMAKVIDFGIAKATEGRLTDQTLTAFALWVGTPLYLSPEQAALSGSDVDTRSDVYSLGVLLYELLTSSTPLEREQLQNTAFDEIRRIILEEDRPAPSARVRRSGPAMVAVAENRQVSPRRLILLIRGELDWIIGKAIEKDRTRRYGRRRCDGSRHPVLSARRADFRISHVSRLSSLQVYAALQMGPCARRPSS